MKSKFFDEVIVISLRGATDKQKAIKEHLDGLGISYTLWEGWNGKAITNPSFKNLSLPGNALSNGERKKMRMGELGCLLSWVSVIQYAKSKKLKGILCLEDDVVLSKDFKERMKMLDEECPEDAELILLGSNTYSKTVPKQSRLTEHIWEISKSYKHFGTFCYIVTEKGYDHWLDKQYAMENIVDVNMVEESKYGNMTGYMMLPFCGYNPVNHSEIAGIVVNNYSNLLFCDTPNLEDCPAVNEKWQINRKGKWPQPLW
jgi:glycosyl transferase family 25